MTTPNTRILGIDPGLRNTGYAVLDLLAGTIEPTLVEAGVITLSGKLAMGGRLHQLYNDLLAVIDEFSPAIMAVEKLYAHYKHPRTAILMAHARGVILLAAADRELDVVSLPANLIKKSVTGYGHASKEQIQCAIQSLFNLNEPPNPPDVADAIAIALTCARRQAVQWL